MDKHTDVYSGDSVSNTSGNSDESGSLTAHKRHINQQSELDLCFYFYRIVLAEQTAVEGDTPENTALKYFPASVMVPLAQSITGF